MEGSQAMPAAAARYDLWVSHPYFDAGTRAELDALRDNPREIEDRFYRQLAFGTGGLRALIGAGTNRINRYTVRHATAALAQCIGAGGDAARGRGVVIAHDSRRFSTEFALETALTLNAFGIPAYLWDELRPTPMLSFAVRELGASAGVAITASHNPAAYNGYKVDWEDGGQVPPERAAAIAACMEAITDITAVVPLAEREARARGLLRPVPADIDRAYADRLLGLLTLPRAPRGSCRILYTPLHGAGAVPVRQVLTEAGFAVSVVREQEQPDPEFSTVKSPNPEEPAVFDLALQQAVREQPDVIMATDPDADRLGVMVRDGGGEYRLLTGNQIGALLVDYLLASKQAAGTLPANGAVIKTIATTNLVAPLCREHGVKLLETHVGFKFIGDKIREFEETGSHTFLFGLEESYGYLGATFVRDKDAVMAALLVAEAAAYHKGRGDTLYAALERLWQRCGCFVEAQHNVTLPGKDGQERIAELMRTLRRRPPGAVAGVPLACTDDYATGVGVDHRTGASYPLALDRADVLHYRFADGGFVMVRPSGTEPKLKVYCSVVAAGQDGARQRLQLVREDVLRWLGPHQ